MNLLAVFLGGGLGALCRHLTNLVFIHHISYWATFIINVLGSFIIGCLGAMLYHKISFISPTLKLFLVTGFLGGFTTFSSFQLELLLLVQDGQYLQGLIYSVLSIIVGFLAVSLGFYLVLNIIK